MVGATSYYDFQPWWWPQGCDLQRTDRPDATEVGCTFEGVRRTHRPGADCTVRNSAYYSVLAAEWPGVKEHLTRLLER